MEARLLNQDAQLTIEAVHGSSIQQILDSNLSKDLEKYTLVFINGQMITDRSVTVVESDSVLLAVVPQGGGGGGKNILGAVLTIAVMVAAVVLAAPTGGASLWLAGATGMSATTAGLVIGAGVSMIGMMAISALIPPPAINTGDVGSYGGSTSEPTYSISGQSNQAKRYGAVTKVYGRHKVFPNLATNPHVVNMGTESRISALYDFGLGDLDLESLQIGDSPISTYGANWAWHQDSLIPRLNYIHRKVGYEQLSYVPQQNQNLVVKTKPNTVAFDVELSFPRGLAYFNDQGNPTQARVQVHLTYRRVGDPAWQSIQAASVHGVSASDNYRPPVMGTLLGSEGQSISAPAGTQIAYAGYSGFAGGLGAGAGGNFVGMAVKPMPASGTMVCDSTGFGSDPAYGVHKQCYILAQPATFIDPWVFLSGSSAKPFTAVVAINGLPPGEYEIGVLRATPISTDNRRMDQMVVTMVKSYADGSVLNLNKKHSMLEMELVASDKVSGVVQNLSGIVCSKLRYTRDGVTFQKASLRNPAWIAIDILTGEGNPKPLADSMIDWPSWVHFGDVCYAKGYNLDFVVDYSCTVQELLNSVLSSARASLMITSGGKYGVLIDEEKTVPRQLITPANSWGFSGSRTFVDPPHAFRVSFINPDINWQRDERIVYADGYDANSATKFETLDTFGITDKDEAYRYGRYMMAQGIHRSETFSVTMDVENLVVQRGDLVHVANDVVKVGGIPCRVVSVSGLNITVNADLSVRPTGYSVRLSDGSTRTGSVSAIINDSEFTLDNATGISSGDLVVLGIMDRVVQPYLVQAIVPGADLTAEISMVKYVKEVYTADTSAIPPWNPGFGDDMINKSDLKVTGLTAKQTIFYVDRMPFNKIDLGWSVDGFGYKKSDIYYSVNGGKQILLGSTDSITEQMIIDLLKQQNLVNVPVEFEVIPVNNSGVHGTSSKVTITPLADVIPPADVDGFSVNIQDMLVEIFWNPSKDKDIDFYTIRYSPDPVNGVWNASQVLAVLPHNVYKTSAGARTGLYFIQATDTSGNVSNISSQRTTVEYLPNVNQVMVVNDQSRGWDGTLSGVAKDGTGKIISGGNFGSVNPDGFYYVKDFVVFDSIYEVRVSSKILVHGITENDYMKYWLPMSSAKPLAQAKAHQWNASLQVRTSDSSRVMADWVLLDTENPIENISANVWSPWRSITVSDITCRVAQFRIRLESFDPKVKAVLTDGSVEIDSSDWVWKVSDEPIPATGKRILFQPAFMNPPALAITIDGASTYAKYEVLNKSKRGFDLRLLDGSGTAIAGKVDISALGQGRERTTSI